MFRPSVLLLVLLLVGAGCRSTDRVEPAGAGDNSAEEEAELNPPVADPPAGGSEAVAALVDGEVVTRRAIEDWLVLDSTYQEALRTPGRQDLIESMREKALWEIIDQRLALDRIESHDFQLDAADEKRIEEIIARRAEDFGSLSNFKEALKTRGESYENYRERLENTYVVEKYLASTIRPDFYIPPHVLRRYYREHKDNFWVAPRLELRHILIRPSRLDDPSRAESVVRELRQRVLNGEPFEKVAREASHGPRAEDGGLWVFEDRNGFVFPIPEKLEPRTVSEVIETARGYHLIYIESEQRASHRPFEEVQTEIRDALKKELWEKKIRRWQDRLRKKASIQVFHDVLAK